MRMIYEKQIISDDGNDIELEFLRWVDIRFIYIG